MVGILRISEKGKKPVTSRTSLAKIRQLIFIFIFLTSLVGANTSTPTVTAAAYVWTAYNDVRSGGHTTANTTTIAYNGLGTLLKQADGSSTGITAAFTRNGSLSPTSNGADSASGTDAYNTFYPYADMAGVVNSSDSGWWHDLTLSGLDQAKTYTFAGSAARGGNYPTRNTTFILSGDDAATNASTSGVTVVNDHTIAFNTGGNASQGYVVRWTGIHPGSDGTIVIRARASTTAEIAGSEANAYGLSVFMLAEETTDPTITTSGALSAFSSTPGEVSAAQSYTVSGVNLAEDIVITAPVGFELSTDGSAYSPSLTLTRTDGTVPSTTVFVRMFSADEGTFGGSITHVSAGAVQVDVPVSGEVSWCQTVALIPSGDAYISEYNDTNNYGASTTLKTTSDADYHRASFFQWDMSSVPSNAIVSGASLTLYVSTAASQEYHLYNLRQSWTEGTGSGSDTDNGATWLTYNGVDAWGEAGASSTTTDREDTNLWAQDSSSFSSTGSHTVDLNGDGIAVVQGWISGTSANNGLTMQNYSSSTSVGDDLQFASSENSTTANRPKLNITYCVSTDPFIMTAGSLTPFFSEPGMASTEQSYTVSGSNLTENLVITAPADFEISTTSGSGFGSALALTPSGGSISATRIYVRFNPTAIGTSSGNIVHTSGEAAVIDKPVSGTASNGWVSYNDCVYLSGQPSTNITTYECFTNNASGLLMNYANGSNTPVTVTITTSGTIDSQTSSSNYGAESSEGTDAYTTFHGIANMVGGARLGATTATITLSFTGLNPSRTYTFATTANRADSDYTDRLTRFTISDVDTAANASTSGVTVNSEDSVTFSTGYNTETGYVTRWTAIQPGADGDFTVTFAVEDGSEYAYGPAVFLLQQEESVGPTISTLGTLSAFNALPGIASAAQTYTVSGSSLTGDVTVTAPAGFELSTGGGAYSPSITLAQTDGIVPATTVSVRLYSPTEGSFGGNITHTSAGATQVNLAVSGAVIDQNVAPNPPLLVQPADGSAGISASPVLEVTASDLNAANSLNVSFYGRAASETEPAEDFTIVLIPDIQNESEHAPAMLTSQMNWIVAQRDASNIVFVTTLGDTVNTSSSTAQYETADAAFDLLDAGGIWYTVAPGNHDSAYGTTYYADYFGVSRYASHLYADGYWFGGSYNDFNTYSLFSASGNDFLLINLQYSPSTAVIDWADTILKAYPDRRAIVEQHDILNVNDTWNNQASFNALRDNPNLFLMVCGHMHASSDGAAYRAETGTDGHTIHVVLADYQDFNNGNGWLRVLRFSPINDMIYMTTYSPYTGGSITTDPDQKDLVYDMNGEMGPDFTLIGTVTGVANGANASITWAGRDLDAEYEWFAVVDDGTETTSGPTWSFTTGAVSNNAPVITEGNAIDVTMSEDGAPDPFSLTLNASDVDGDTLTWSIQTAASHGAAIVEGNGNAKAIAYAPAENYAGSDSFVVRVSDNKGGIDTITVNVVVSAVNDAPVCSAISQATLQDTPVEFNPACSDIDNETLQYEIVTPAEHGAASINAGMLAYSPNTSYTGMDTFTYQASDGSLTSNPALVTIDVTQVITCYPLTLNHTGSGSNPVAVPANSAGCAAGQYLAGEAIALSGAAPDTGWQISGWSGTSSDASTAATNNLTMPASAHAVSVTYTQIEYSLTVISAHGTVTKSPDQATYHYGDLVTLSAAADPGWTFTGWTPTLTGNQVTITGDANITANYSQNEYALTIVSAHGTVTKSPDKATYHYGDVVTLSVTPAAGWTFINWTPTLTGNQVTITDNMSVTANYEETLPDCYVLTLSHTGSGSNPVAVPANSAGCAAGQYVEGEAIALSGAAPDTGWQISGWSGTSSDASTASTNSLTMPASAQTVSVTYTQIEYSLTVVSAHGTVTKSPDKTTYHYGDVVALNVTPAAGWTFTNWSPALTGNQVTITGNTSVTANYSQIEYTLTVISDHGTVTKTPNQATYHYGDVVALSVTPAAGWTFTGWTPTLTNNQVTITGNTSVTANYTQNEYTLTIVSAHGTVTKTPNQTTYHYGDVVTLSATAAAGWTFTNWTPTLTGNQVTITGNMTVTANYTQNEYTLTIVSEHGTVTKTPNQTTYHYGDVVTLSATAAAGWTFASWTPTLTGNQVTITGNTSVTANYSQIEYSLTVISDHGTVTKTPNQATYHYGDIVTLSVAPAAGWNFSGWTPTLTGNQVTITSNTTITANYEQTEYALTIESSINPSVYGQLVTFTATVTSTGEAPDGSVTFYDGEASLGTVPLDSSGEADLTTAALQPGTHSITAEYEGTVGGCSGMLVGGQVVNPVSITITAQALSKVYGETDPALLTYQITSGALVPGDTLTGTLARAAGENVGAYAITQGTLTNINNPHYDITFIGASFTITPRAVAVTANAQTKVYGSADPALTYTFSPALVTGDSFTGGLVRAAGENAGTYAITQGSLALSSNYTLAFTGASFTITPRTIAVTASAQTKVYGSADPALTYTFSPALVTGDSFTGGLARAAGENAGTYAITQGSLALSSNYTLTFTGASFTITKATLTVTANNQTRKFMEENPAFTYTITGFVRGDTVAVVTGSPVLSTTATKSSPIGEYPITITAGSLQAANYNFIMVNGKLTITENEFYKDRFPVFMPWISNN